MFQCGESSPPPPVLNSLFGGTQKGKKERVEWVSLYTGLYSLESVQDLNFRFGIQTFIIDIFSKHLPNFRQLFRYFIVKNIKTFKIHFRSVVLSFSLNAKPEIQILMGL